MNTKFITKFLLAVTGLLAMACAIPAQAKTGSFLTVGGGVANVAIRDPVAPAVRVAAWYPELGYTRQWGRRHSLHTQLAWMRILSPARPGRIHNDTRGGLLGLSYAWRWPWTRYFHPHFHIGIEYLDMRSRERFSVDSDGFVTRRFPPRAHRQFNFLLGVSYRFHNYGWGQWIIGLDWHDPFGLSRGFAGGLRTYVRYQFSLD